MGRGGKGKPKVEFAFALSLNLFSSKPINLSGRTFVETGNEEYSWRVSFTFEHEYECWKVEEMSGWFLLFWGFLLTKIWQTLYCSLMMTLCSKTEAH